MAKVFVLTFHAAYDCEFYGVRNEVFKKKEDALKAFEEIKKKELMIAVDNGWIIETDEPEHYEAFEDGRYCTNHTEGYIRECDIE